MHKPEIIEEWNKWCNAWDSADHQGKLGISRDYEISYDTARHWRSDCNIPTQKKTILPIVSAPVVSYPRDNTPTILETPWGMSTAVVVGDYHNPYQDNTVVQAVDSFLEELQPDYLFYNGDINDFYQVSVFSKDPSRLGQLQSDIDISTNMFERHHLMMPFAKKVFIEGTHENRWFKYLQDKAPAVAMLRSTNITELYRLTEFDIDYVPFERGVLVNGTFLILHGNMVSAHSSYTAKRQHDKNGGSGMCNHTHRGGSYYKTDRFGIYGWWENFCLCELHPDWIQNTDWQHGFSVIHFHSDGRFWVEQIPIIEGRFIYGGKIYGGQDEARR